MLVITFIELKLYLEDECKFRLLCFSLPQGLMIVAKAAKKKINK